MKSRFDAALRVLAGAVPAIVAAAGVTSAPSAAHDDGVIRTIGAGFTGAFRALDLIVAAPSLLLPLGTRAARAGFSTAIIIGICGVLAFDIARMHVISTIPSALHRIGIGLGPKPTSSSTRLYSAVAFVGVLSALLSPIWQTEASAPGGSVTGALLVLLSIHLPLIGLQDDWQTRFPSEEAAIASRIPIIGLLLGLAASYEPLTLLACIPGVIYKVILYVRMPKSVVAKAAKRAQALRALIAFMLGLTPLALGVALKNRAPEISLTDASMFALPNTQATTRAAVTLPGFALTEIGTLFLVVCLVGAVLSLLEAHKPRTISLLGVVAAGAVGVVVFHVPAGPSRFAPVVLAGVVSAFILGATTLGVVVIAISRAKVPFAEASAALVVVLELVLPIKAIDDTSSRREARLLHASSIWNDVAWGAAPPASIVLIADKGTMRRVASARATGEMRGDLLIVPSFDVQGYEGQHALIAEPKLAPLYRDMALSVPPEELSLAQLGAERPVLATFDPKWDRALSRHLVPVGLTNRFEPEPRGASDRKKALDAFTPSKDHLVRATVAKKDPELASATAHLLRARAIGMAATGERDILSRALDDLRSFAPDDPVGTILVRRIITTKGPIDVHDL